MTQNSISYYMEWILAPAGIFRKIYFTLNGLIIDPKENFQEHFCTKRIAP